MLNKAGFAQTLCVLSLAGAMTLFAKPPAGGKSGDWPQWRGPKRDGISVETGLVKGWGADGPKYLWRVPSGEGYSGISVSDGRLYTAYGQAASSDEYAVCLDAGSGQELWRWRMDSKFTNQFGHGSRTTPLVHAGKVYVLSAGGKIAALDANKGTPIWQHDLVKKFGGRVPTWGVSTSPLVYHDVLLVDVGGKSDFGFMAFNKNNGQVVWKTATDQPGYSAPILITVNGVEQVLCFTGTSIISVNPKTGEKYWAEPWKTNYDVNVATPVFVAPDKVFISSGYGVGGALFQVKASGNSSSVQQLWKSKVMRNHFSTSILYDNHLVGFDEKTLRCVDLATQESKWAIRGLGKGSLTLADGQFIVLGEKGKLVLIEANTSEYVERASVQVLKGRCWTVPTLSNGVLYLRNQKEIVAIDFKTKA